MFDDPRSSVAWLALGLFASLLLLWMLKKAFVVVVGEDEYVLLTRWGKFKRVVGPGLHAKLAIIDGRAGKVSRRLQLSTINATASTKDGVVVTVKTSIRHRISEEAGKIYQAFYGMLDPVAHLNTLAQNQISKYVGDRDFAEVQHSMAAIAEHLLAWLREEADANGYILKEVAVTSIDADEAIRDAGNRVQAAQRAREVQIALAEAETARKDAASTAIEAMYKNFKEAGLSDIGAIRLVLAALNLEAVQTAASSKHATIVVPAGLPDAASLAATSQL